jgi:CubicO group peptidase (beta-lactamase class C family)
MGILLAARIAEFISGLEIRTLVDRTVFQPLGMKHSAVASRRVYPAGTSPAARLLTRQSSCKELLAIFSAKMKFPTGQEDRFS